jgi:hypothetical protein
VAWWRQPAVALTGAFTLIAIAWTFTTPPFSSPDEWAHYLRALSLAHGQVLGHPTNDYPPGLTPGQQAWVVQATRIVDIPPHLAPDGFACNALAPSRPHDCVLPAPSTGWTKRTIPNGTYQPAAYLPAALVIRLGQSAPGALYFARLANALVCALLLFLAARSLSALGARPFLGVLLACPPMALFLAGMLNPSGLEIFGTLALFTGLTVIAESPTAPRVAWTAATVGAVVLPLSRSLGGAYLPVVAGLWAAWVGPRRILDIARRSPRPTAIFGGAVVLGFGCNRLWEKLFGPSVPADTHDLGPALSSAWSQLPGWLKQEVGLFQYTDVWMPEAVYVAWFAVAAALVVAALAVGTMVDRVVLLASVAVAVAVPLALQVLVLRPTDWLVQGRHVMAVTLPVFLVAAEVVRRRLHARLAWLALTAGTLSVWATAQLFGFWSSAQRTAVGIDGPRWFFGAAVWHPPLGWAVWFVILLGAVGWATMAAASALAVPKKVT